MRAPPAPPPLLRLLLDQAQHAAGGECSAPGHSHGGHTHSHKHEGGGGAGGGAARLRLHSGAPCMPYTHPRHTTHPHNRPPTRDQTLLSAR